MKFATERIRSVAGTVIGQRFAVALASWSCAGIGVMGSFLLALSPFLADPSFNDTYSSKLVTRTLGVAILVAWIALGVMTKGWVQGRRVSWVWPITGTITGIPTAVLFSMFWPIYISAVPLAIYLVYFHLAQYRKGRVNAV